MKQSDCQVRIVAVTCDKYSKLIPGFVHFQDKYWPDRSWPLEVVAEAERPWLVGFPCWFYGRDRGWASNMIQYLQSYDENFIFLLLLDDYYASAPVDTALLEALVALMQADMDIGYIRLRPWSDDILAGRTWTDWQQVSFRPLVAEYNKATARHLLSLQPSLWQRDTMLELLREGEDGWQTEIAGTERARSVSWRMMGVAGEFPYPHVNVTRYGEWRKDGDDGRGFVLRELGEEHKIFRMLEGMLRERVT